MTTQRDTNRFLDLVQNAEPITSKQITAIVAAVVLAYLDGLVHFTNDPSGLVTPVVVYVVVNVVGDIWARAKVWSERSHVREVAEAINESDTQRGGA